MLKSKVVSTKDHESLEKELNSFLSSITKSQIVEIKYSNSMVQEPLGDARTELHTAIIIYSHERH